MAIEHLVISGGGPKGLVAYGALQETSKKGVWSRDRLKSIWATSFGSIIALLICLDYSWEDLDDYIIKRPWQDTVNVRFQEYVDIITTRGLITNGFCKIALDPLLLARDIPIDITLQAFAERTGIELHFFATDINTATPTTVELSSSKTPDIGIVQAVTMSTAVPVVFPPVFYHDSCFIDGGILNNYPVEECLSRDGATLDNVLGFNMTFDVGDSDKLKEDCSVFEFLGRTLRQLIKVVGNRAADTGRLKHEVACRIWETGGFEEWVSILKDSDMRSGLIAKGREQGVAFSEKFLTPET